jgi:hypothetical protein
VILLHAPDVHRLPADRQARCRVFAHRRIIRGGLRSMDTPPMTDGPPEPEIEHYANGLVKLRGFRLDGEMHGAWEWFRTDGTLMRTGEFERGRQVGVWRTVARDGRVVKETAFSKKR